MSVFQVSNKHISAILGASQRYRDRYNKPMSPFNPLKVGQMLLDENILSYNARYPVTANLPSDVPATSEAYREALKEALEKAGNMIPFVLNKNAYDNPLTVIETIKLIDCLEYQSCESEGWEISEAKCWLDMLKLQIISNNPEWDAAEWAI